MGNEVRFWDKIAASYAKQSVSDEASYLKKLQMTQALFHPDMELLEFGCGTGSTAVTHAPFVNHIQAIDFSSKMLTIAQERALNAGVNNITFKQSTLEALSLADESKDVVLGLSVLHLLPNYRECIQRVFQIVKPGGYFVSSTVCLGDLSRFLRLVAPVGKFLRFMPVVSFFKLTELETELKSAGFDIETKWQPNKGSAVFIIARKPE